MRAALQGLVALALAAGWSGGVVSAVADEVRDSPQDVADSAAQLEQLLARQVGNPVVNPRGEELGEVREVVRNPVTQQLFVVVTTGGVLGIGARDVVVPADAFAVTEGELLLRQDLSQEQFEQFADDLAEHYEEMAQGQRP
ncbi:PRC-barrel domain-containing protein [Alkalilimnicola ehrlichii]|nr:PRC-barrel domain-containing protein [Alkalilimnicola ehrlichii]